MIWKITTTRSGCLAVIGPYDEAFIADLRKIRGAHFDGRLKAWLLHAHQRDEAEAVIAKHSPPPMVELKSGSEGVEQVLEHAGRLGPSVDASDITAGLELAGMTVARVCAVEVDGRLVVVAFGNKSGAAGLVSK